jgi:hypothetical protein
MRFKARFRAGAGDRVDHNQIELGSLGHFSVQSSIQGLLLPLGNAGFTACIFNGLDACTVFVMDHVRAPPGLGLTDRSRGRDCEAAEALRACGALRACRACRAAQMELRPPPSPGGRRKTAAGTYW